MEGKDQKKRSLKKIFNLIITFGLTPKIGQVLAKKVNKNIDQSHNFNKM